MTVPIRSFVVIPSDVEAPDDATLMALLERWMVALKRYFAGQTGYTFDHTSHVLRTAKTLEQVAAGNVGEPGYHLDACGQGCNLAIVLEHIIQQEFGFRSESSELALLPDGRLVPLIQMRHFVVVWQGGGTAAGATYHPLTGQPPNADRGFGVVGEWGAYRSIHGTPAPGCVCRYARPEDPDPGNCKDTIQAWSHEAMHGMCVDSHRGLLPDGTPTGQSLSCDENGNPMGGITWEAFQVQNFITANAAFVYPVGTTPPPPPEEPNPPPPPPPDPEPEPEPPDDKETIVLAGTGWQSFVAPITGKADRYVYTSKRKGGTGRTQQVTQGRTYWVKAPATITITPL